MLRTLLVEWGAANSNISSYFLFFEKKCEGSVHKLCSLSIISLTK